MHKIFHKWVVPIRKDRLSCSNIKVSLHTSIHITVHPSQDMLK